MEKYSDWSTFNKVDNASTIDFLTSLAASLTEQNQFSERELVHLKQSLANQSAQWSQEGKSVITMLTEEKSEALAGLVLRYGIANFSYNHTRFAIKPLLLHLQNILAMWAGQCLKKSELVFNRSFFVWSEARVERRELFSQVLYSLASQIHSTIVDVQTASNEVSTMRPSDILDITGDVEKIDSDIAVLMGFTGLDHLKSFSRGETRALKKISMALSELVHGASDIISQVIPNCQHSESLIETTAYLELLASEIQRFSGMTFPNSTSTLVWEMRRRAICFSLHKVTLILEDLSETISKSIQPADNKDQDKFLSRDIERRVAIMLFAHGLKLQDADDAAKKLIGYCLRHEIMPDQIIDAELKKIHPMLTPAALELFRSLSSQDISATPGGPVVKKRLTQDSSKIKSSLAAIGSTLMAFLFVLTMNSCGFKTPIRSDVDDLRPPLPPAKIIPPNSEERVKVK